MAPAFRLVDSFFLRLQWETYRILPIRCPHIESHPGEGGGLKKGALKTRERLSRTSLPDWMGLFRFSF